MELLQLLKIRDIGEDRGHRRRLLALLPEHGGAEADGKLASLRRDNEALAPADLAPIADPAVDRRPQLAGAGLELVQDRLPEEGAGLETQHSLRGGIDERQTAPPVHRQH